MSPDGTIWYAWSDNQGIRTAESSDHGQTWSCSKKAISTGSAQAVFPWLVATSGGIDLDYYGAPSTRNQTIYVYLRRTSRASQTRGTNRNS